MCGWAYDLQAHPHGVLALKQIGTAIVQQFPRQRQQASGGFSGGSLRVRAAAVREVTVDQHRKAALRPCAVLPGVQGPCAAGWRSRRDITPGPIAAAGSRSARALNNPVGHSSPDTSAGRHLSITQWGRNGDSRRDAQRGRQAHRPGWPWPRPTFVVGDLDVWIAQLQHQVFDWLRCDAVHWLMIVG